MLWIQFAITLKKNNLLIINICSFFYRLDKN